MLFSPLSQFDIICILPFILGTFEFSVTNLTLTLLCSLIVGYVFFVFFFNGKIIPGSFQIVLESVFLFIFRLIKQQTGREGLIYLPLVLSLFTFILFLNLLSLTPFAFAVTSHLI
jgi:F-type H+-transporting ATPase subunit a